MTVNKPWARCTECGDPLGTITKRDGKRLAFGGDCGDGRHLICHERSVHYWDRGHRTSACEICGAT